MGRASPRGAGMIAMDPSWRSARSILAVRLDGVGDLLMTTPALRALKEDCRDRSLTLLTSPAGAIAARELPFADDVNVFTAPWMKAAEAVPALDVLAIGRYVIEKGAQ